jgi:hypothetical protein
MPGPGSAAMLSEGAAPHDGREHNHACQWAFYICTGGAQPRPVRRTGYLALIRLKMITGTYVLSGALLAVTAYLFDYGLLSALTIAPASLGSSTGQQ